MTAQPPDRPNPDLRRRSFLGTTAAFGTAAALAPRAAWARLAAPATKIDGLVETGWEPVADAFRASFAEGKNLGAGCCVYVDGRPVVDLWGGVADQATNRPWARDTVIGVASTTKGATALCAHLLAQRGQLDLDAPVARYWPEFGQAGKEAIPVKWLLSHQAGLPIIDTPVTFEEACAWDPIIRALEVQKPLWTPGTEHLYHAQTYGFLVGEVIRRITGKTVGAFFADEVAGPLGLSAWIGLPEEIEPRLAQPAAAPSSVKSLDDMVPDFAAAMQMDPAIAAPLVKVMWGPDSVLAKAGAAGGVGRAERWTRQFRAAQFPASNMVADAHSIARMYAATVSEVDGVRLLTPETVAAMSQVQDVPMHNVPPQLLPATKNLFNMAYGFWGPSPPPMPLFGPASFGHPGSGGSLGAGDPQAKVGFGYVPNLGVAALIDMRAGELTAAVKRCLG